MVAIKAALIGFAGYVTALDGTLPSGYPSPWGTGGVGWDDAYAKAKDFVRQLTLTEKVNLTTGSGWEADVCVGNTGSVPRLGFRGFCLQDGPLGIRYTDHNSAFPAGINLGATWSRSLMRRRGEAMGEEFYGKGIDVQLGPVAGPLGRVPAGGRNWEGFSPDPYLSGVAMAETIKGIQSRGVIATAKHYILNEQEHYRGSIDVKIDDRAMHELYLWPFADAVRAGVGSVMCSYNKINGNYSCENSWTTNYLLKNELNFQGFVMSDWNGQHSTVQSALTGLDMTMPGDVATQPYGSYWGGRLTEAILRGEIPEWRLDDMVVRIMAAYYKVKVGEYNKRPDINFSAWTNQSQGYLHPSSKTGIQEVNKFVDVQSDHAKLIREIGAKSVVLLKNAHHVLPLHKPKSIAVVGNDAQDTPGGPNACPERACISGTLAMGYGSGTAQFPYLISPASALLARAETDGTAFYNISDNWNLSAAGAVAAQAEVAIVFASADAGENIRPIDGNAGDRNNLTLWDNGDALIQAVAAVNNQTVVVLHTVGPVLIDYAKRHPNITAILWAGLPGQESGNALADVLYGDVNPQGRTPFTWAKKAEDYGVDLLYQVATGTAPSQNFSEGIFIDYRHFQHSAVGSVFEFGAGLSYTSFRYANLSIVAHNLAPYVPPTGTTKPASLYGTVNTTKAANEAPAGFSRISPYVYPWLASNASITPSTGSSPANALNGSAQPVPPAGGAPGGHAGLYDVVYTLTFGVKNTGNVVGTTIPQLYVQLGGDQNPWGVLRGFDEVRVQPGQVKKVQMELTRRDISNWDTKSQNWIVPPFEQFAFIGESSTQIQLNMTLPSLNISRPA